MRPKAIKDLCRLSDNELFAQISTGYGRIIEHALSLNTDAEYLASKKHVTSNRVLATIASEEAAKCLILLDAIRCPRTPTEILSNHLEKFNDHLAKALYSHACYIAETDFEYLSDAINSERQEYYLDGPNDYDWVWVNQLKSNREETLYVDYIELDDGQHIWITPSKGEFWIETTSLSLRLAKSFYKIGCIAPTALKHIADFWRPIKIIPTLTYKERIDLNWQMLKELNAKQIIQDASDDDVKAIIETWMFPMYELEMKMIKGNKTELAQQREQLIISQQKRG